jgi:glutathione S-transferase
MPYPVILHHFEESPFSEKIRTIFGFKGVSWRSVRIPRIMPKPDLMPLTGGYHRTPVMQIGTDIFCDTQIIIREIERSRPSTSRSAASTTGSARSSSISPARGSTSFRRKSAAAPPPPPRFAWSPSPTS